MDEEGARVRVNPIKDAIREAGVDIVYDDVHPQTTQDFTPFLTKMKYEEPDVFIIETKMEGYLGITKQIMEIGGWDGIKVVGVSGSAIASAILNQEGMKGAYVPMQYIPGISAKTNPAAKEFEELWAEKCEEDSGWAKRYSPGSKIPNPNHAFLYTTFEVALKTIELAGTDDPAVVAETMRSGEVELWTTQGYSHLGTDGSSGIKGSYVKVLEGGEVELIFTLE